MKALYTVAAIAAFGWASAQSKVALQDFHNIAVSGKMSLTFVKATKGSIEINKGQAGNLKIASDGENLALSLLNANEEFKATVYYTGDIENIAVGGGAEIYSKDAFTGDSFALAVSSGSKASVGTKVKRLQTAAASGSNVTLTGSADKAEVAVASGAFLDAGKVKATDVEIAVASGAKASINANGTVDVNIASGAELTIHGNPKQVNEVKATDAVIKRVK